MFYEKFKNIIGIAITEFFVFCFFFQYNVCMYCNVVRKT